MAKPDSPDDYSFLPTVEDNEVLSKDELWRRAKEQARKRQPATPAPPTKEQLWAQAKGRKATIRALSPSASPTAPVEPEALAPEPEEATQSDWQQTINEAFSQPPPDEEEHPPPVESPVPSMPVPRPAHAQPQSIYETPQPLPTWPTSRSSSITEIAIVDDESVEEEPTCELTEDQPHSNAEPTEPRFIRLGDPDTPAHEPSTREKLTALWERVGGGSLTFSIALHASVLLIAGLIVFTTVHDPQIDFMPGGGTQQGDRASQEMQATVQKKRMPWTQKTPLRRLAIADSASALQLPDDLSDIPMPDVSSMMDSRQMGAFGFGKSGAGGGFGDGIGTGGRSGVTFKPISMFGFDLKGKKLCVILDVSASMLQELPKVVREADKVAQGSVIICYYGCGLSKRERSDRLPERAQPTSSGAFRKFWTSMYEAPRANDTTAAGQVFDVLSKRRNTYFIDVEDTKYAWLALLADELLNSDTVYWFSDFLDSVDDQQIKLVEETMKRRRQRLYIQNIDSYKGIKLDDMSASFQKVRHDLVEPTGGEVVEPLVIQK
jgi:hypothetical protein